MPQDSNNNQQRRIVILPIPAWGLYQVWRGGRRIVRQLLNRRQIALAGTHTSGGTLFGTHKDPFCAAVAQLIWQSLNDYRTSLGLRVLAHNDQLAAAARYMGKRMLQKNEFEHVLSDQVELTDRVTHFGYQYSCCGENLAKSWGMEVSASALASQWHSGWIASPGHHLNMIRPEWEEVGVAVVKSYSGTPIYYGIENFGTPA